MTDNDKTIKPCPMPGCGGECRCKQDAEDARVYAVHCLDTECRYRSAERYQKVAAITTHNQTCKYVRLGKLVEKLKENPPETPTDLGIDFGRGHIAGVRACLDMVTEKGGK